MNTYELNEMTVADEKVLSRLVEFLGKVGQYKNFNDQMTLNVYVDTLGDFVAMEAKNYRVQFCSIAHKLSEIMSGTMIEPTITFKDFKNYVLKLYQR